ncbi:hypothetical protein DSO57_1016893 [Entomophthora muscae]|uniref:Uncharacterized protein n=1 Tax=Entomophthora muscae TaxID=34485 RepID=A0ACC2SHG9_9FUNG|nr:hypothetical protein DSO57_1016893 [Entomophthora muscae]
MTTNLISSMWKNTNLNDPKRTNANTADANKALSSQVQNLIVNQSLKKVEMPQMGKLTLKEAQCAMPVLCLHFQTNTPSYASDTKKILGVASMLLGDALDWFGKATAEEVEFCLDYAKLEAELMATGEDCNTRYYALNSLLEIRQGPCGVPVYQSPKCVLDRSQGPAGRDCHSLVRENVSQKYV